MLKFKQFLLFEDLGIGPEGGLKNPSLKDNIKKDKQEEQDLYRRWKMTEPGTEKDLLRDQLMKKRFDIASSKSLASSAATTKPTDTTDTVVIPPTITEPKITGPDGRPLSKDDAKTMLGEFPKTSAPTSSSSISTTRPTDTGQIYNVSPSSSLQNFGTRLDLTNFSIEQLGKTAKSYRL